MEEELIGFKIFGVEWKRVVQLLMTGVIAMYFLMFYSGACILIYLLWTRGF